MRLCHDGRHYIVNLTADCKQPRRTKPLRLKTVALGVLIPLRLFKRRSMRANIVPDTSEVNPHKYCFRGAQLSFASSRADEIKQIFCRIGNVDDAKAKKVLTLHLFRKDLSHLQKQRQACLFAFVHILPAGPAAH